MGILFILFVMASLVSRGLRFFLVSAAMYWGGARLEQLLHQYIDRIGWIVTALIVTVCLIWQMGGFSSWVTHFVLSFYFLLPVYFAALAASITVMCLWWMGGVTPKTSREYIEYDLGKRCTLLPGPMGTITAILRLSITFHLPSPCSWANL